MNSSRRVPVPPFSREKREPLLLVIGLVLAALLVALFPPTSSSFYPPCLLKSVTGLSCPGCGGLRALNAVVSGNFYEAHVLNPLVMLIIAYSLVRLVEGPRRFLAGLEQKASYNWALILFLLGFTIVRNLNSLS